MFRKIIILLIAYFLLGALVHAQVLVQPFALTADPQTALSHQNVRVLVSGSNFDETQTANYTWFLDGKKQLQASGASKKAFNFIAGDAGTTHKISVKIDTSSGKNLTETLNLRVVDLLMSYTTDTFTPVQYPGLALAAYGTNIIVSATPIFKTKDSISELDYNWSLDGDFQDQFSGVGQTMFVFKAKKFPNDSYNVSVEVSSRDKTIVASRSIIVKIVRPEIAIYAGRPDFSKINHALKSYLVAAGNSASFFAWPYFFNAASLTDLSYDWSYRGEKATGAKAPNQINFMVPQGARAESNDLTLSVVNLGNVIQAAAINLPITITR